MTGVQAPALLGPTGQLRSVRFCMLDFVVGLGFSFSFPLGFGFGNKDWCPQISHLPAYFPRTELPGRFLGS